jgi:hypothetical protein
VALPARGNTGTMNAGYATKPAAKLAQSPMF